MEQIENHDREACADAEGTSAKKKAAPTCSVCLELIYEPQVGACGHSLCAECVPDDGKCPYCRTKTTFQTNFMLREILEQMFADDYEKRGVIDIPERWVRRHKIKNKDLILKIDERIPPTNELVMKHLAMVEKYFMVDGKLFCPEFKGMTAKLAAYPEFKAVWGAVGPASSVNLGSIMFLQFASDTIWIFSG